MQAVQTAGQARKRFWFAVLEHWAVDSLTLCCTFWALFASDIKVAAGASKSTDTPVGYASVAVMALFTIEIVLAQWVRDKPGKVYRWSVYMALDIVATVSMLLFWTCCF